MALLALSLSCGGEEQGKGDADAAGGGAAGNGGADGCGGWPVPGVQGLYPSSDACETPIPAECPYVMEDMGGDPAGCMSLLEEIRPRVPAGCVAQWNNIVLCVRDVIAGCLNEDVCRVHFEALEICEPCVSGQAGSSVPATGGSG